MRFFHRLPSKGRYSCGFRRLRAGEGCHNGHFGPYSATEVMSLSCAICSVRKEKRFCSAIHGRICPQCCGEQRELTLDCPSDCTYLQQARQHQEPRRLEDVPAAELFSSIEISEQFLREAEPLLMGVWHTLARRYAADPKLTDREVIGALANMAKSYQILVGSGLVYQEATPGLAQQAIMEALGRLLEEFRALEQKHLGYAALKDGDVLKALVFSLRLAHMHTSGRLLSRGFLDFLREQFPEKTPAIAPADEEASRLIVP
jgi:hypothetical protein